MSYMKSIAIDQHNCMYEVSELPQVHAFVVQEPLRVAGKKLKPMWGRVITHYS